MWVNMREVWMVGRGLWWEPDSSLSSQELFRKLAGRSSSPSTVISTGTREGLLSRHRLGKEKKKIRKKIEWFDEKTEFFHMCLAAYIAYGSNEGPKNVKAVAETSRKHHKDFPLLSINHWRTNVGRFQSQSWDRLTRYHHLWRDNSFQESRTQEHLRGRDSVA